jgi:tRNA pseudouridine55 synthase
MDGILIIDKPAGITSHDVVARCRRILKTKRIGHTGTLDPFATGVMVVLVERATRLAQFLDKDTKEYEATVRLGFETDTGDRSGELRVTDYRLRDISTEDFENVFKKFRGEIEQTPPMYSAKKVEGKKLYELARKGIEIERKAVTVNVYKLELLEQLENEKSIITGERTETAEVRIRVACSAGTYIRVLAEDIGQELKTGAHLAELRRTQAGKFGIEKAVTLKNLEEIATADKLGEVLVSTNEAIAHLPEIKLSTEEADDVKNGKKLNKDLPEIGGENFVRLTSEENLIAVGVYNPTEKTVQPKVVLI